MCSHRTYSTIFIIIPILEFLLFCSFYSCLENEADFSWGEPYKKVVNSCTLSESIRTEIRGYKEVADKINDYVHKEFKGKFYSELALFVDTYGSRLSGSTLYDKAIDYMEEKMRGLNLNNAHPEAVTIPNWFRGEEEAYMISPRRRPIEIVGLGQSISTPPEGITAQVVVIPSFSWINKNKASVTGKIALFNLKGSNRKNFKIKAGRAAYRAGAVAVLGKSLVSMSMYTVTARSYLNTEFPIPIASMTSEDVELMVRLANRGQVITMYMKMVNTLTNKTSKNLMGDYVGRPDGNPTEIVIIQGHMDSWDVSQGAQDNGCGAMMSLLVPAVLKELKLVPRRTLRSLMTVSAEYNFLGSRHYLSVHHSELPFHSGMLMSDAGCAAPVGYIYTTFFPRMGCLLDEFVNLFSSFKQDISILITPETYSAGDVFVENGVPCIGLNGDAGQYYWYRHTYGDTMSHVNSDKLDDILAFWTTTAYIVADMYNRLTEFK